MKPATDNIFAPWQGAVSLTFDDGTPNQLDKAVPLLDEYEIRGTFFLTGQEATLQNGRAWKTVAKTGHEIGNHSLSHTCSETISGSQPGLESITIEAVEADLLAAGNRLRPLAPHQNSWTFAYPCYGTHVGRGATRESYVPVVARHFLAGRGGGEFGFANSPALVDLACVAGLAVERRTGFELIGLVEELTYRGDWVVLVFHEIGGDQLSVELPDFRMLLRYLARRKSAILTAPFGEIAGMIRKAQRQAGAGKTP